ncbi:hypothetical protein [Emticicia sp. BO119]|uniref:hypothetical protein n=1 Tax=Emticicia sp. BO119 TaxID=2757768 RepID=UPI0015F0E375|nr:hypothetical protein [Emticicia sp. BO119]MBA4848998.1 hypothetical protein [Emticicia sp. BO119]
MKELEKPFPEYFGGKGGDGVYQFIINHIRPHEIYIEGCAGNVTIARKKKKASLKNIINDINPEVAARLTEVMEGFQVENVSVLNLLKLYLTYSKIWSYKIVIYLDPPYLHSTRKSRTRYPFEMSDEEHVQMLDLCLQFDPDYVDIIISTYPNELYANKLKGWAMEEYESRTRSGKVAKENLYMNFHEIKELHEYTFYGKTHRQRQLIKRKVNRWKTNFKKLSRLERDMMFKALKSVHGN